MPPSKKPEDILRRALDKAGLVHLSALRSVLTYKSVPKCIAILKGELTLNRKDINYLAKIGLTREDLGIPDELMEKRERERTSSNVSSQTEVDH